MYPTHYTDEIEVIESTIITPPREEQEATKATKNISKTEVALNWMNLAGSGTALVGNVLLHQNGIMPMIPGACLVGDLAIATSTSAVRTLMSSCGIENEKVNKILMLATLASAPLLPTAVVLLNPLPLNPQLADVWGCFIPATVLLTGNHLLTAGEATAQLCDETEQPEVSTFRKIIRNASSVIAPAALGIMGFGVWNMYQHTLAEAQDQETIDRAHESFIPAIVGLGTVCLSLTLSTVNRVKNYITSTNALSSVSVVETYEEVLVPNDVLEEVVSDAQFSAGAPVTSTWSSQLHSEIAPTC